MGQTSGLTVGRASGPEFPYSQDLGAGGSVIRQTGGLTQCAWELQVPEGGSPSLAELNAL